jgi:gliding motility-associated-like protein
MRKILLILLYLPIIVFCHGNIKQVKYIENKGQWQDNILFKANIPEGQIFLEDHKLTYSFMDCKTVDSLHHIAHEANNEDLFKNSIIDGFAFSVNFLGSNKKSIKNGVKKLSEYHNYFIGKDEKEWQAKVPLFNHVEYHSIYNGIDLKIYNNNQFLKYDFIVAPNANTNNIQLYYDGITPKINNNQLEIDLGFNTIIEQEPYAYQIINNKKIEVKCQYILQGNIVSFYFPDGYEKDIELVIDPTLVAATLSGTTGNDNYGHSATYGVNGEIFTGAISFGAGYPTTVGAFQQTFSSSIDVAISKLNPDGSSLIWATYLGGTSSDYPHSMMVNGLNELYIYGTTSSNNYPVSSNAFSTTLNGFSDIYITHLTDDGTNIVGSTYIGGNGDDGSNGATWNYGDTYRGEIIVDNNGNTYVASCSNSPDFPTSAGCYQSTNVGGQDGVVFKMNPDLSVLEWSTYLGSTGEDAAFGIRLDNNNNVFVTGTAATNFPTTASSATPNFIGGTRDAFIAKLDPTATTLLASSYYGSIADDASFFLDIDANNDIYIYGQNAGFIPITAGCYGTANSSQFIAKFDNDLANIEWQTTIGTGSGWTDFIPIAFMVDICSHIYISGHSATSALYTTADAFYTTGGFYLMSLSPDATSVEFATYYTESHVDGGTSRFDPSGTVYQGVCSGGGFATTSNAYSTSQATGWDIGVFKIDFELINFASINASPSDTGCAPFTVDFTNNSSANTFFWDFDDSGQISYLSDPTYTFNNPGTYNIDFIATDTSSCSMVDTVMLQIIVLPPLSTSTFDTTLCDTYSWNGTTYTTSGVYNQSFSTNLACDSVAYLNLTVNNSNSGSALISSCKNHTWQANNQTYATSGNYTTILTNILGCDSIANLNLTINNNVFSSENIINCDRYLWHVDSNLYTSSGTYTDTVFNSNGCDSIITLNLTINKSLSSYDSISTCHEYLWPINNNKYTFSGTFLDTIISSIGCDSIVHLILDIENITFFAPNSFTPNQDEHNELFRIVSAEAIAPEEYFEIRIFNRWGKNIYHSNDIEKGWDGTLDGNFMQQGVYVWEIQYTCRGKTGTKIGTVTLIN